MRKWVKWTLGGCGVVVVLLALVMAVLLIRYWSMVSILRGTEGITGVQTSIPEPKAPVDPPTAGEHDWVSWRGAGNDGRSTLRGIKKDWSGGLTKIWEVDYLCQSDESASWSAPVIRGNRLIVPGRDSERDLLFALDPETGDLLWSGAYVAAAATSHGPGPRATPTIEENRVYTFGRSGDLVCWNIEDGSILWRKNVKDEGGEEPTWGYASSPYLDGAKVFVQAGGQARTIAYHKLSGDVIWKSGQGIAGYAAFSIMETDRRRQLMVFHGKGLAGLDSADGSILWDLPWETPYDVHATTPIVVGDRVLMTSGYGRGSQLVRVSGAGAKVEWTSEALASQHSDPFVLAGKIYGYSGDSSQNRGAFKCIDLETGTETWTTNDIGWGSCTWVEDHLICIDIRGNLNLVKPDPERFVRVAGIEDALGPTRGPVWTLPVVANGRLYLRFKQRLVCYDLGS